MECIELLLILFALMYHCDCINSYQDQYLISHEYKAISYNYRQKFLILHYTAIDLATSLKVLTGNQVSSHYVVPENPVNNKRIIYQLVSEDNRAWTNGVSSWRGSNNLNDQAVGVEIVNLGYLIVNGSKEWQSFKDYQIDSVIQLSKDVIKRYNIEPTNVFGHADCSPGRKVDPGPLFPWKRLYEYGVGAWPDDYDVECFMNTLPDKINLKSFQLDLSRYGYLVNTDGVYTTQTTHAVISFQMHFRQKKYDGIIDKETVAILKALIKKYRL